MSAMSRGGDKIGFDYLGALCDHRKKGDIVPKITVTVVSTLIAASFIRSPTNDRQRCLRRPHTCF